jgi:hypothetical protein
MINASGASDVREKLLLVSEIYSLAANLGLDAARRGEQLTMAQSLERALISRAGGEDEICLFREALHDGLFGVDVIGVFNAQDRLNEHDMAPEAKAAKRGWRVLR